MQKIMKRFDWVPKFAFGFGVGAFLMVAPGMVAMADSTASEQPPTRQALETRIRDWFAKADENLDGYLSRAEFDAAPCPDGERETGPGRPADATTGSERPSGFADALFGRTDINNDGQLSVGEAPVRPHARFDAADTDHDGVLSDADREAARARMRDRSRDKMS